MASEHKHNSLDLIIASIREISMLMSVNSTDTNLIASREKTVIVQRKIPSKQVIQNSFFKGRHPNVYIYNKHKGVFAECICELSFDNIHYDDKYKRKGYYEYGKVPQTIRYMSKTNPNQFAKEVEELIAKINLNGTCLSHEEFKKQVSMGNFIFFIIKDLIVYDTPLGLDDFHLARFGKKGIFTPSDSFKSPSAWCYAIKKTMK